MNREYEIGFVINPESSDEEVKKITDGIGNLLKKGKSTIENVDEWGKKKLAYPIEKHSEGIYFFYKILSPGDIISSIERRLKLNEKVLRFMVLRLDDKLKKTNRLEKKWTRIDKLLKKRDEERGETETAIKKESKTVVEKEVVNKETKPIVEKEVVNKETKPMVEKEVVNKETKPMVEKEVVNKETKPMVEKEVVNKETKPVVKNDAKKEAAKEVPIEKSK